MHNLLMWPLSQDDKIVFSSQGASLASITCCDPIDISLSVSLHQYQLASGLTGCKISAFKVALQSVLEKKQHAAQLDTSLNVRVSKLGQILVEIFQDSECIAYYLIDMDIVTSWIAQLELLEVLMQENENEQKNRNKGCC
jgi:hypothetical protein